jgi:transcription elongation factor Elf1
MMALAPVKDSKQTFECLRCGHQETRRPEVIVARG